MSATNEAAFLRAIAGEGEGNIARLVFADWLEENGDGPRADFIRVQCELAAEGLSEDQRHSLRLRERALLDAHRQQWCQAFGLPLEDVEFERGLISRMRLGQWSEGDFCDPACVQRLATLTELNLSGLELGDKGLATFAKAADFPALKKLILSDNGITNLGATALAGATELPNLETVYLFGNSITDVDRNALERSTGFLLGNLDAGELVQGYCMSPGQTEMARREYIRTALLPLFKKYVKKYQVLQSAMLCIAQYWNDNASDAVHAILVVSELFEPTMEDVGFGGDKSFIDRNLPTIHIIDEQRPWSCSAISLYSIEPQWDENEAIPLWAAFAPEGGTQHYDYYSDAYAPAVMFYRHGGYQILPMRRPALDGVMPEWGREE